MKRVQFINLRSPYNWYKPRKDFKKKINCLQYVLKVGSYILAITARPLLFCIEINPCWKAQKKSNVESDKLKENKIKGFCNILYILSFHRWKRCFLIAVVVKFVKFFKFFTRENFWWTFPLLLPVIIKNKSKLK